MSGEISITGNEYIRGYRIQTMVCHVVSHTSENALKNFIIEIIERDILRLTLTTI